MKKLTQTIFCALFFLGTLVTPSYSSFLDYSFKIGAGRPGEEFDGGKKPIIMNIKVPHVDSMDIRKWYHLGGGHYVGAPKLPVGLMPSSNIFGEWFQLSCFPKIAPDGSFLDEEADDSLPPFVQMAMPPAEDAMKRVVCHLFMPKDLVDGAGAELLLSGSKGFRYSEWVMGMNLAKQGVPCLAPDFIGTDHCSSSVSHQLHVSFYGRGLGVLRSLQLLQQLPGVNRARTGIIGESIGSTHAVIALLPEIVAKFPGLTLPSFLALSDLAPMLGSPELQDSPFWTIPKIIWGGREDQFTPLSQLRKFLEEGPDVQNVVIREKDGVHDRHSLARDTFQQSGETFFIPNAQNFTGFSAHLEKKISDIRQKLREIGELPEHQQDPAFGAYMMSLKLHVDNWGLEMIQARLIQEETWRQDYNALAGSDTPEVDTKALADELNITYGAGLDFDLEATKLLLKKRLFAKEHYTPLYSGIPNLTDAGNKLALKSIFKDIGLPVPKDADLIEDNLPELKDKLRKYLKTKDIPAQIRLWKTHIPEVDGDADRPWQESHPVPEDGVALDPPATMAMLGIISTGGWFGPTSGAAAVAERKEVMDEAIARALPEVDADADH